jgi:hypothetical protein
MRLAASEWCGMAAGTERRCGVLKWDDTGHQTF